MGRYPRGHGVSMRRGSVAGAAYAALLALAVAGCAGASGSPHASDVLVREAAHPAGPPTPLTAVQAPLPLTPTEEVSRVLLRSSEIPSSQQVRWPAAGRRLSGPTLAFCPARLSTDGQREARRVVTGNVPHSPVLYADQVTAYDSAATARAALHQVRRAAGTCATTRVASRPAALAVRPSFALLFSVRGTEGPTYVALVAQQRGDVVDVLTLTSPRPVLARQERLLLREAGRTGQRLVRLPLASTGA
jgi:hypothetical protein